MSLDLANTALNKAKIALMSKADSVFFTTLCFSMKFVWDATIPTACIDGRSIFLNPEFFLKLPAGQRVTLLVHETLHAALLHFVRIGSRDRRKWNIAGDYSINWMLAQRHFEPITGWLCDSKYADMTTEQIYDALPANQELPDELKDMLEPEDLEELNNEIQDALIRAVTQAKLANDTPGSIPGEVQIFLDKLLNPQLPWQRILQKYLHTLNKNDYSFRKPNRRFFPQHILPSMYGQSLIDLVIAIDTSGSVTDEEFNHFVSEVAGIFRMMKPNKITLIQFDTDIKSVDAVSSITELSQVKFTGRGGTYIGPVLEWANTNKPQLLLVFSDGYFHFHQSTSKVDTLWLIHNNNGFAAPFGKTIHYTMGT